MKIECRAKIERHDRNRVHGNVEISCVKWVEWAGLLGLQVECLESIWSPDGVQVDLDNNLAGLPA